MNEMTKDKRDEIMLDFMALLVKHGITPQLFVKEFDDEGVKTFLHKFCGNDLLTFRKLLAHLLELVDEIPGALKEAKTSELLEAPPS